MMPPFLFSEKSQQLGQFLFFHDFLSLTDQFFHLGFEDGLGIKFIKGARYLNLRRMAVNIEAIHDRLSGLLLANQGPAVNRLKTDAGLSQVHAENL